MKIKILVALTFAALLTCQPVYADDDICQLAGQAIGMSAEGVDSFFQDNIKELPIVGSGTVLEVTKGASDQVDQNYTVLVDCGNRVMILLQSGAFWVENSDIRKGSSVSFNGECVGIERIGDTGIQCIVERQD